MSAGQLSLSLPDRTLISVEDRQTYTNRKIRRRAASLEVVAGRAFHDDVGDASAADCVGGIELRAPTNGSLLTLERNHAGFVRRYETPHVTRMEPAEALYVPVHYVNSSGRPYAAFRLLPPETGKNQTYAATDPVKVAGMIRGLAGKLALESRPEEKAWIDQFVYGHHNGSESFDRFSYLPLPSLQPVVGVGRIGRVLIAEPLGAAGKEIAWIKRLLAGQLARNEQGRDALLVPLTGDYVLSRYVEPAACWTTVTPVALPGSDDGVASKTDKLLEKMFRHAGYSLDGVAELDFHRTPFLRGAEDAKRYRPCAAHYLANCTMYHMRIRWKLPMPGPIALGAGRHCGLGIFAVSND